MTIYFCILLWIIVVRKRINSKKYNKYDVFTILIMGLTCGLRYKVGADYSLYIDLYNREIFSRTEIVNQYLIYLLKMLNMTAEHYIFIMAMITITIFYISIKRLSNENHTSLLLFIVLGYYAMCFNGIRQMLAMSICLYSIKFISEKNLLKYVLCITFAGLCHTTAFIMYPFYYLYSYKIGLRKSLIIYVIGGLSFLFYNSIFSLLTTFIHQYSVYSVQNRLTFWKPGIGTYLNVILTFSIIFIMISYGKRIKELNERNNFFYNCVLISTIFYSLCLKNALFIRVAYYFAIYMIFIMGDITSNIFKKKNKIIVVLYIFWLIYFTLQMKYLDPSMVPYTSILFK